MGLATELPRVIGRAVRTGVAARVGRYRHWPNDGLLLAEPLALAERRTSRLRRIYDTCGKQLWDGPAVFREAMERHGGIQADERRREALVYPLSMLMWGELAAWIVSAELAERLEDPDARMAASSQVFDEARHFYVLRDYVAALHVPPPKLDPFFATALRRLLASRDLTFKLLTMQILAEGAAQSIFRFLVDSEVEPVLGEVLPYVERDEARHVGLGILHLPERLEAYTPRERRRLQRNVSAVGDLFAATQIRYLKHYRALGADPRELIRRTDKLLFELSRKLGTVPGTDEPYFRTDDPSQPGYEEKLDFLLPPEGARPGLASRFLRGTIERGSWLVLA